MSNIDTLVFSGGGSRGFALLGTIKALEEKNIKNSIKYICGTSIGSLFALLYCIYDYNNLYKRIHKFSYENYQSLDIVNLFEHYGFDNFSKIKNFIIEILGDQGNITFEELYSKTGITLIIDATCLNTLSGTYFHRLSFPDMNVITAIEASMALPFIFPAVKYKGLHYIDGGLYNPLVNLEILSLFHEINLDLILCINLYQEDKMHSQTINNFIDYASQVIAIISKKLFIIDLKPNIKILDIFENETVTINFINLIIPDVTKNYLIDIGYKKTLTFLNEESLTNKELSLLETSTTESITTSTGTR